MIVGIVAGIVDGVVYSFHLHAQGIGFFSRVPWGVLGSYITTWPGNVLTFCSLGPFLLAWVWLSLEDRFDTMREAKHSEK